MYLRRWPAWHRPHVYTGPPGQMAPASYMLSAGSALAGSSINPSYTTGSILATRIDARSKCCSDPFRWYAINATRLFGWLTQAVCYDKPLMISHRWQGARLCRSNAAMLSHSRFQSRTWMLKALTTIARCLVWFSCLQDAPRNSSKPSSSSTSKDGSATTWLWLFGLGSLVLAALSAYATHTTACAAVCSITRLMADPEKPLRLAMSSAALLIALPQLVLVTCTLSWNAFVLLAPVVSSQPCIQQTVGRNTAAERMSAVTADATVVVACLA
jgi:hypothetical protein